MKPKNFYGFKRCHIHVKCFCVKWVAPQKGVSLLGSHFVLSLRISHLFGLCIVVLANVPVKNMLHFRMWTTQRRRFILSVWPKLLLELWFIPCEILRCALNLAVAWTLKVVAAWNLGAWILAFGWFHFGSSLSAFRSRFMFLGVHVMFGKEFVWEVLARFSATFCKEKCFGFGACLNCRRLEA